jgi:Fe-S oxidoreductase
MATREEKHSTRGRANTLRLAMAGGLAQAGLGPEEVYEVLDLCLECRACKAECPVGVDVARFKSEFLAEYWRRHGTPLRARAVGHIQRLLRVASVTPGLSARVAGSAAGRWLGEALLGIDRRRTMPAPARSTFRHQLEGRTPRDLARASSPPGSGGACRRSVALFNDTFTNYCHPEIGMAAVEVLESAGFETRLTPNVCCGRPLISQGLLEGARKLAARNAASLAGAAAGGRIVFLEPSCLSAVREDGPALLRGELQQKARAVAAASVLFEEFVEDGWRTGALDLDLPVGQGPRTILLHGHCHQKAMGLVAPARALLERIPAATVVDLDAGCCGMAGSFGYASEHYEISRQIGERKLLPAARSMTPGAVLVASGTSCREQVSHFAGVRALHPAVLLQSLLAPRVTEPGCGAEPHVK